MVAPLNTVQHFIFTVMSFVKQSRVARKHADDHDTSPAQQLEVATAF
jgi:hypothetical protein